MPINITDDERRAIDALIPETELIARVHHDTEAAPRQREAAARAREIFGLPESEDARLFVKPGEASS
jgi:hypothetical protein